MEQFPPSYENWRQSLFSAHFCAQSVKVGVGEVDMRREFCEKLSQSSFFAYGSADEEETRERKLLVRFWKMFSWRMGVNLFFFFF